MKPELQGSASPSVSTADRSTGYAAVFATVIIWSLPSLFQYYLNRYYDPWAQNFYRYSVAGLAIVPFLFLRSRQPGGRLTARLFWLCVLPCLPNVIHQVGQVLALYYIGPGVYAVFWFCTSFGTSINTGPGRPSWATASASRTTSASSATSCTR